MPVLARIKAWLDAEGRIVLPRSPIPTAITYAREPVGGAHTSTSRKDSSASTTTPAERALKRVAIGRKNWLFAGNDAAAENHARLWSLIASAERHGVDPHAISPACWQDWPDARGRVGPIPARRVEA